MVYCPECGAEINSNDVFCGNCGIALTPIVPFGEDVKNAPISEDEARDNESSARNSADSAKPAVQTPIADYELPAVQKNFNSEKNTENPFAGSVGSSVVSKEEQKNNEFEFPVVEASKSSDLPADEWATETEFNKFSPLPTEEENVSSNTAENQSPKFDWQDSAGDRTPNSKIDFDKADSFSAKLNSSLNSQAENNSVRKSESQLSNIEPTFAEQSPKISSQENVSEILSDKETPKEDNFPAVAPAELDFQATLPYTPNDFAQQESLESKIVEEKPFAQAESNKLSPADSEKFAVSETAVPIEPPNLPVGSSMHDSLEPKLVSVQIYNPKEKPEDVEPPTLLNSTGDVKAIVEQAKAEQSPAVNRQFTSPNIGNTETDGKGKAKLKPLDDGTVLNNRYEIVRKIGGGGMGAVYLASDRNLGGISRAVKEMVQSYIEDSQQEKAVNDFRRESMLLTSLEHPSIPTIYDYFFDDKEARFYLVMKYIAGGDLAARLRSASEGKIDEAAVTEWGIQLADVLDYLHNRQPPIVYRDLKPSNIMIDGNTGKVMLIDFGIARWVNKEEKGVTAVGTMGYAPPELFSGNVEPRSDIYSLGSTLFHLLTGADPQSNPLLIFDFHKNPRPRQINSQLSDQMEQILMKMVEYNAEKRFSSAAELRDALANHFDNLKKGRVTMGVADSVNSPVANQPVFCGFCGQKIMAADVFCPFCGAQQASAGKASGAAFVTPKAAARLMIIGTNELESLSFNLEKDTNLIGRRDPLSNIFPEVDLSKFDPQTKISRRHARIWRDRDSFMVEDLGSSNGTTVINRNSESQKLGKNQPHPVVNGDKIRVGDTTLFFVFE